MKDIQKADTASLVEAARALRPQIEACVDQIEQDRQLPQPLVDAMIGAGLFKMLVPESYGGSEATPETLVRVIEEVSRFDASAGWCVCLGAVNGMASGCLPEDVAVEIFGRDNNAYVAASAAPAAVRGDSPPHRAVVVEGGYRVNGRWAFASGCMHATWLMGAIPVYEGDVPRIGPNGKLENRYMCFPRTACQIIDTWNVAGLRGSGSHDFAVWDVFVPHERTLLRSDKIKPQHPGALYIFGTGETLIGSDGVPANAPWVGVAAISMAAVCLGVARGAIDALIKTTIEAAKQGGRSRPENNPLMHDRVGRAEATLRAARSYVLQTVHEVWEAVQHTGSSTPKQMLLLKLAATHAATMSVQAVDLVRSAAGTSSIYLDSPLERRVRDIHVATQNIAVRSEHYANAGKVFLDIT